MSNKTNIKTNRLKEIETFNPVPYTPDNQGMESVEGGKWVKLSDVQTIMLSVETLTCPCCGAETTKISNNEGSGYRIVVETKDPKQLREKFDEIFTRSKHCVCQVAEAIQQHEKKWFCPVHGQCGV